jgi:hypothetical protein
MESDLLHFTGVDDQDRLPVFTSAPALRAALLENPEWQQLNVLEVDGGELYTNRDPDVALVINPFSTETFELPARQPTHLTPQARKASDNSRGPMRRRRSSDEARKAITKKATARKAVAKKATSHSAAGKKAARRGARTRRR